MYICFSVTADDYREFQQAYFARLAGFWHRNHFKIFVSFGVVAAVAGLNWIYYLHRDKYYGFVCIVCGLYLIWRGSWLRFWQWRRWFSRNFDLYQNIEVDISEGGVKWRGKSQETNAQWEYYLAFTETENLVLLMVPQDSYVILPKRAFEPADLDAFRTLLRNKLRTSGAGSSPPL